MPHPIGREHIFNRRLDVGPLVEESAGFRMRIRHYATRMRHPGNVLCCSARADTVDPAVAISEYTLKNRKTETANSM